jgi:hypothetical protein
VDTEPRFGANLKANFAVFFGFFGGLRGGQWWSLKPEDAAGQEGGESAETFVRGEVERIEVGTHGQLQGSCPQWPSRGDRNAVWRSEEEAFSLVSTRREGEMTKNLVTRLYVSARESETLVRETLGVRV